MSSLSDFLAAYKELRSVQAAESASGYILREQYPPAGFYVYALIDPRDDAIFYIGKGIGGRVLKHEERTRRGVIQNRAKVARMQSIWACGQEVKRRILMACEHEEFALAVETDIIRMLHGCNLTNIDGAMTTTIPAVAALADSFRDKVAAFRKAWAGSL